MFQEHKKPNSAEKKKDVSYLISPWVAVFSIISTSLFGRLFLRNIYFSQGYL